MVKVGKFEDKLAIYGENLYYDYELFIFVSSTGIRVEKEGDKIIISVDKERFAKMVEKVHRRVDDMIIRALTRLQRQLGLEIEDERAKTTFLCALGYMMRAEKLIREIDEKLGELKEKWIAVTLEDVDDVGRLVRWYQRIIEDVRKDNLFREAIESIEWIEMEYKADGAFIEWELEAYMKGVRVWHIKTPPQVFPPPTDLKQILKRMRDNLEDLQMILLGKSISGK